MPHKTIGIIGGMGPLATVDLFQKIVQNTAASCDQEHIPILIDNNTAIPDRTAALLCGGADPFPQMKKSALRLATAGAEGLIMPCNTAHHYHARLQAETPVPILNMIELTCRALQRQGITRAGLLATTGTIQAGVYQTAAQDCGVTLLTPEEGEREALMDMIYRGVKAGRAEFDTRRVRAAVTRLMDAGAETMILGCTELPLAAQLYRLSFPAIDPTLELARGAILFAGGTLV